MVKLFFFSSCWSTCQSHFPRTKEEEEEEGGYLYFKRLLFVRQGFQFQADISNMTRRLGYILCKSLARTRHFRSLFTLVRLSAPEFFSPFCGRRFFLILSLLCTRPRNAHLPAHFSISLPHISLWPSFNVAQSNPHNESNRQTAK